MDLPAYRVDGWRQAFLVPAGAEGTATLSYRPDRYYRTGLLLGFVAAVGLLVVIALPNRRGTGAPAGPARLNVFSVGVPLLAGLLVGAGVGAAVVGVVWLLAWAAQRSGGWPRGALAARSAGLVGLGVALVLQVVFPWPGGVYIGTAYDLMMVIGPALALGALSVVAAVHGGRDAGSASPASAN